MDSAQSQHRSEEREQQLYSDESPRQDGGFPGFSSDELRRTGGMLMQEGNRGENGSETINREGLTANLASQQASLGDAVSNCEVKDLISFFRRRGVLRIARWRRTDVDETRSNDTRNFNHCSRIPWNDKQWHKNEQDRKHAEEDRATREREAARRRKERELEKKRQGTPHMPRMKEDGDVEAYLAGFERHMKELEYKEEQWMMRLRPLLSDCMGFVRGGGATRRRERLLSEDQGDLA